MREDPSPKAMGICKLNSQLRQMPYEYSGITCQGVRPLLTWVSSVCSPWFASSSVKIFISLGAASAAVGSSARQVMIESTSFIAQRDPHRARRARRHELLRSRCCRIESAAGPGEEGAAEHAEALVTAIEEIVHLERNFPLAAHAVARERLGDAVSRNGAVEVAVVFVAARVLAAEPGPAQTERSSRLGRPVERELYAVLRDSRDCIAALHGDLIGGVAG